MRNRNCATTALIYSATLVAIIGCGGSSDDTPNGSGGNVGIGGAATGGIVATTGGKASTGGAMALTGGSKATGGNLASGGNMATGVGGVVATTGGAAATGGIKATGGTKATGGRTSTGDAGSDLAMCSDVCTLLEGRTPPLSCVPDDCRGTCNRTYDQLNGVDAVCSDAYVAYYECGLSLSAAEWDCLTIGQIDIPTPPSAGKCNKEYQALYNVILTHMNTCGAALSW